MIHCITDTTFNIDNEINFKDDQNMTQTRPRVATLFAQDVRFT